MDIAASLDSFIKQRLHRSLTPDCRQPSVTAMADGSQKSQAIAVAIDRFSIYYVFFCLVLIPSKRRRNSYPSHRWTSIFIKLHSAYQLREAPLSLSIVTNCDGTKRYRNEDYFMEH